jgi:hypothetical protein
MPRDAWNVDEPAASGGSASSSHLPRVEIEDGARDVGSISDKTLAAGVDLEENEEVDEEDVRADQSRMR